MAEAPRVFEVAAGDAGDRLDRWLARRAGVSRRVARTWIATGRVLLKGRPLRVLSRSVRAGWRLSVTGEVPTPVEPAAPEINLVHVDRWLVVVNKPPGILSEGGVGQAPSLESAVPRALAREGERNTAVWLVHRLDAATSGAILLARTAASGRTLDDAFRRGVVKKHYLALCAGRLEARQDINVPIARKRGTVHHVARDGKPARTVVVPGSVSVDATLVHAYPHTGRTHQIRVHLAHVGHPLVGDRKYGGPGYLGNHPVPRAMLHAFRITFDHPHTGEPMTFEMAPPPDFQDTARRLEIAWEDME